MPNNNDEVKIVKPELSIHKKIGTKFDEAFDKTSLKKAEETMVKKQSDFKAETANDYAKLTYIFETLSADKLDKATYEKISEIAFSIKSRAGTGGLPLASEIANSMYKFSDAAIPSLPKKGFKVLKLHYDAMLEIFNANTAAYDEVTSRKLIKGLEEVAQKFLTNHD